MTLTIEIVDLPGTYSLSAFSPEEVIARDFIINEKPDARHFVVDAANLERNLYLAVQILELDVPLILVLNMTGYGRVTRLSQSDTADISQRLGAPCPSRDGRPAKVGLDDLQRPAVVRKLASQ